jgi:hypothetical protein
MGREVLVDSKIGNPSSNNWPYLIGFIVYVLHPLIWFVMKLISQILCKWIPISSLLKRHLLKFYANEFGFYFLAQKFFFSSILQIGTHVLFSQDLCETTSCRSNSWTNQICSKLHKINPSLKLHQEFFSPNKYIANQPNWFKSTKFESLDWNQSCLGSFMEVLE